ncbi:hypothetical protein LguiA_002522 [Lonicera macranthoides]
MASSLPYPRRSPGPVGLAVTLGEVIYLFGRIYKVIRLSGRLCEVICLSGRTGEVIYLSWWTCEMIRLSGRLCEVIRLSGRLCEVIYLSRRTSEVFRLYGRLCEMIDLFGRTFIDSHKFMIANGSHKCTDIKRRFAIIDDTRSRTRASIASSLAFCRASIASQHDK